MAAGRQTEQPQPDEQLIEAFASAAEASVGYELDDDARQVVRETVKRHQTMAMRLRPVPLRNADEPDFVFVPYRAED